MPECEAWLIGVRVPKLYEKAQGPGDSGKAKFSTQMEEKEKKKKEQTIQAFCERGLKF